MKAVLCKQFGPPESLVVEEVAEPVAGKGQVVVAVKAASVNFPDVLIIQNKYQVKPPLPFSPGSEMAGVVKSLGEGVTGVKPGDRVIAFSAYGAFAEQVAVDAARLIPIPEGMDFVTAASFLLTYGTSHHALSDRARPEARRDAARARRGGRRRHRRHRDRQDARAARHRLRLQRRQARRLPRARRRRDHQLRHARTCASGSRR